MRTLRSVLAFSLLASSLASACLWNSETVVTEEIPFPTVLELVSGNFPRHGQDYYRWVVQKRRRLISHPQHINPPDYDELAWALDKLGKPDSAVAVMLRKRKAFQNSYETMANLGTFLFHSGKLAEGLPYIDSALQMNPDAHFGREIYQRYLVEYFLLKNKALPMDTQTVADSLEKGFAAFVAEKSNVQQLSQDARAKAVKGVLGMMRFGDHTSPVLLEALADLMRLGPEHDSLFRGALGYLQASRRSKGEASKAYRKLLKETEPQNLSKLERMLSRHQLYGDARFAKIVEAERAWIQRGVAVDSAYRVNFLVRKVKRRGRGS